MTASYSCLSGKSFLLSTTILIRMGKNYIACIATLLTTQRAFAHRGACLMLQIRYSAARGVTNLGWLDSRHTFSFGSYYDPRSMGVSALRVLNEDHVQPGAGFDTHGHQDMEILTYVTEGVIAHQDSMGHTTRLPA